MTEGTGAYEQLCRTVLQLVERKEEILSGSTFFFSMTYIARSLTENARRRIIRAPEKRQEGDKVLS